MRIDRTRTPEHKARTVSRRLARVEKSALAFALLAFSDPAIGTAATVTAR